MALDASNIETRVLALERRINRIRKNADDLYLWRVPGVEQNLGMLWALGPKRPATIVTGQVYGCDYDTDTDTIVSGLYLANSTVQFTGGNTGFDYGTFPAADGTFAAGLALLDADLSLNVTFSGPAPRFANPGHTTVGISIPGRYPDTPTFYIGAFPAIPATGYSPLDPSLGVQYPVANAMLYDDPFLGVSGGNMTYAPSIFQPAPYGTVAGWLSDCMQITTQTGTIFSTTSRDIMDLSLNVHCGYETTPQTCPHQSTDAIEVLSTAAASTGTYPNVAGDKFDRTFAYSASSKRVHGSASGTIRIYET